MVRVVWRFMDVRLDCSLLRESEGLLLIRAHSAFERAQFHPLIRCARGQEDLLGWLLATFLAIFLITILVLSTIISGSRSH